MPDNWVPDSCTLPLADQPLRVAEFRDLFAGAVHAVSRPEPTRLRLSLDPSPDVAAQAARLATAETACCSFFTFTLTVAQGSVTLDVSVPASHLAVLDGLAGQATAALASPA
jgi:hypothetical protein